MGSCMSVAEGPHSQHKSITSSTDKGLTRMGRWGLDGGHGLWKFSEVIKGRLVQRNVFFLLHTQILSFEHNDHVCVCACGWGAGHHVHVKLLNMFLIYLPTFRHQN